MSPADHDGGPGRADSGAADSADERQLAFTVAAVWRAERVSCPHADILRAWVDGGLAPDAAEFVAFHVTESQCPYCNAAVDEMRDRDAEAAEPRMQDLRSKLLRSTIGALRERG